jgi:hypothetical protein
MTAYFNEAFLKAPDKPYEFHHPSASLCFFLGALLFLIYPESSSCSVATPKRKTDRDEFGLYHRLLF